jgi:GTP pyrophosphokinase
MEELYADIGVGKRMAALVARQIFSLIDATAELPKPRSAMNEPEPVTIFGDDGVTVQLAQCCLPIPGDEVTGQLKRDQGLMVHIGDCTVGKRTRAKEPERWIPVQWADEINRRFDTRIRLLIENEKGILARVAAEIGESDGNITYVGMDEYKEHSMTQLRFTIQVKDRVHLAHLIRNLRRVPGVNRVEREHG